MYERYVGIKWVKGGYSLKTGCDCFGLVVLAMQELFGIEIKDHKGSTDEGLKLHNTITEESKKYIKMENPQAGCIVIMYNNNIAEHIGLMLDNKNVLHSIKTSSSINNIKVLKRVFKKVEFYQCRKF
jgi:cell wall-associated NlpC family hydrolase